MVKKIKKLEYIKVKLASPSRIRDWSNRELPNGQFVGEVETPDTVNYKTFIPELGGLFCPRIFGPINDYECLCGKYEGMQFENLICDRCGVELADSTVRRHRMGHINLIYPVVHIWYVKSRPNYLSLLLEVESFEKMFNTTYNLRGEICKKCRKFLYHKYGRISQKKSKILRIVAQKSLKRKILAILKKKKIKNQKIKKEAYKKIYAKCIHNYLRMYWKPIFNALLKDIDYNFMKYAARFSRKYFIFFYTRNKSFKMTASAVTELWDERIKRIKLASMFYFLSPNEVSFYGLLWDFQHYRLSRKFGKTAYPLKPHPKPKNPYAKVPLYLVKASPTYVIGTPLIRHELRKLNLKEEVFHTRCFVFNCNQVLNKQYSFYKFSHWSRKWEKQRIYKLRDHAIKRIRLLENLIGTYSRPEWTILSILPIIPPALRPMIQLEGGKFASSDLNELYRRVISRNNRLLRLLKVSAPHLVVRNERRMLQESIDTLIDNGRRGRIAINYNNNRPLKSLSDIIKGKYGRFRQNLLGKRVDYSGRSVIVVGPTLKLNQCGLPYEMALELFQPFIIRDLINGGLAANMNIALDLIEQNNRLVPIILYNIIKNHPIFLNRAPTLHRLGIQAFEPILISGKAIKLHPLVCSAFNADFDGDQMAVHIPLSVNAQAECYTLLLAPRNFLSPANGEPMIVPSQDMVLGCYYLTLPNIANLLGSNHYFASLEDVFLAYNQDKVELHSLIWLRYNKEIETNSNLISKKILKDKSSIEYYENLQIRKNKIGQRIVSYLQTTPGRIIFNYTIQKSLNFL